MTQAGPSIPETSGGDAIATAERTRRGWSWLVSIPVALALVVGIVWAAGGFEYRDDLATSIAPGETFQTGPYEFSFASATIQKTTNYKDEQVWTVVVSGTGRTTADESMTPDYDDMFVVKDAGSGAYQDRAERQDFGAEQFRGAGGGSLFTPGLPAIPYQVTFEFPVSAFDPGSSIVFVAWKLEWRDVSLLQVDDFRWAPSSDYFRLDLPMRRLPDDLD